MTKYIVKNCTSYHWGRYYYDGAKFECCSKNADCPIKQVVWLVKGGNPFLTEKVLNILQVQEVE